MVQLFLTAGNFPAREDLRTGLGAASALRVLAAPSPTSTTWLGAHGYLTKILLLNELAHGLTTAATYRLFLCSAIGLAWRLMAWRMPKLPASVSPASAPSKPTAKIAWTKPKPATWPLSSSWRRAMGGCGSRGAERDDF